MDKELAKILRRARGRKGANTPRQKRPPKQFLPSRPYDYLVFTKLVAGAGLSNIFFLVALPLTICLFFFFRELRGATLYILAVYIACVLLVYLFNRIRYRTQFIGWQERLPFTLTGWDEMIHRKKMFCDLCWNDVRIEVVLTNQDAELLQLVKAALKIFSRKAQKAFYTREVNVPPEGYRNDWKPVAPNTVEGSANPDVMRRMKNLFQKELSVIARKTGGIQEVRVTVLSKEFEVPIEIPLSS